MFHLGLPPNLLGSPCSSPCSLGQEWASYGLGEATLSFSPRTTTLKEERRKVLLVDLGFFFFFPPIQSGIRKLCILALLPHSPLFQAPSLGSQPPPHAYVSPQISLTREERGGEGRHIWEDPALWASHFVKIKPIFASTSLYFYNLK